MRKANPVFIPRNHLVEAALSAAVERQDFRPFEELLDVVSRPYEERPGLERYSTPVALSRGKCSVDVLWDVATRLSFTSACLPYFHQSSFVSTFAIFGNEVAVRTWGDVSHCSSLVAMKEAVDSFLYSLPDLGLAGFSPSSSG